jgi:hypothetical protein
MKISGAKLFTLPEPSLEQHCSFLIARSRIREYEQHQKQATPMLNLLDVAPGVEFGITAIRLTWHGGGEHNRHRKSGLEFSDA